MTYKLKIICDNCSDESAVDVPKGTTGEDYLKKNKKVCSYCGC